MNGDDEVGCTVHLIDVGIDTGAICGIARMPIEREHSMVGGRWKGYVSISILVGNVHYTLSYFPGEGRVLSLNSLCLMYIYSFVYFHHVLKTLDVP